MVGSPVYAVHTKTYSGGRTVTYRCIVTNHDNITIKDIGSSHIGNASGSPYGVNGTFFYMSVPDGAKADGYNQNDNYRICMNNGQVVRPKGGKNRLTATADGNCGTIGWLKQSINGADFFCQDITDLSDVFIPPTVGVAQGNIKWAIGGVNLYLTNTGMTEATFNTKASSQSSGVHLSKTARTAIFHRPNVTNDIVLVAAFGSNGTGVVGSGGGPTLWELRGFIMDTFGANCNGIALDGGGSTQIAYKSGNNRVCVQAEQRAVRLMIQTPMA